MASESEATEQPTDTLEKNVSASAQKSVETFRVAKLASTTYDTLYI